MINKENIIKDIQSFLNDDELIYDYIMSRKKDLIILPETERNNSNKINGCMSVVHLTVDKSSDGTLLKGYSDSEIISGILGIICVIIRQDKDPHYDNYVDVLESLKLVLSQNRRLGFTSIIKQVFK